MAGRVFEEFVPGDVIQHALRRTITETDNVLFCGLTMNDQPLHLDHEAAKAGPFGRPVVNGLLTMAIATGISVRDTTAGTLLANLGYGDVRHPAPVFHGDTIRVTTTVLDARISSRPGRGVVTLSHTVHNQRDEVVCEFQRVVLVRTRDGGGA